MVNVYFAPMEGITGYVYRNAHNRFYGHIDQYYTPFIVPNQTRRLTSREMNDILPEHNREVKVVPQILTNHADDFIWAAGKAQALGYETVNLNLGCPSGTVYTKRRGAGFLTYPDELDCFLETVSEELARMGVRLSVKTRIGVENPDEFGPLLKIFNRYPLERLIIHPRVRTEYYQGKPHMEAFQAAVRESTNPVCYNGDIFSVKDFEAFRRMFPKADCIMAGRGLLTNPALAEQIKSCGREVPAEHGTGGRRQEHAGEPARQENAEEQSQREDADGQKRQEHASTQKQQENVKGQARRLRQFHDELLAGYREVMSGDRNVLFKMKELWFYLAYAFENSEKQVKKIRKAGNMGAYLEAVDRLFEECPPDVRGAFPGSL